MRNGSRQNDRSITLVEYGYAVAHAAQREGLSELDEEEEAMYESDRAILDAMTLSSSKSGGFEKLLSGMWHVLCLSKTRKNVAMGRRFVFHRLQDEGRHVYCL